jgi:aryl-alcohol dehydrogenase-like predicted oxidoreductase
VLKKEPEGRRSSELVQEAIEEHRKQLTAYEVLCDELGEEPAAVALAWLLRNPDVTAPIIGPRTVGQLEGTMHALEIELSDETLAQLGKSGPALGARPPKPTLGEAKG